jgi:WD40 repeat protein
VGGDSKYGWDGPEWEASTGKELSVLRGHTGSIWQATFSPDDEWVVTASGDGTAGVFRCELCGSVGELLELAKRRLGN